MTVLLIAKNIDLYDDTGSRITLERVADFVIDSGWHYSWHWERDEGLAWHPLTVKGWQTALADGRGLLERLESHAAMIRDVLPLIEAEIARIEQMNEDDEE